MDHGQADSWQATVAQAKSERASYAHSLAEKVRFAAVALRQVLSQRSHLIAGPFAGEFGYELMQWQGYVRARRPHYRQVHVITYPGRDYLYEGCSVHYHEILLQNAGYGYGRISPTESRNLARKKAEELDLEDWDVFDPHLLCTQYHKRMFWRQEFRLFQEAPLRERMWDVAFHFRAVDKLGPDKAKNYRPELADELIARCTDSGLSVACIGHPDYAYCARGAEDVRSVDLKQTVAAISSARAVAGENSGPMHLANLCGKPTILWAQDQFRIDYSLRWNPFRVPIFVAANHTHQPEPAAVCQAILRSLDTLKASTDGFSRPCFSLPAQGIAPW